MSFQDLVFENTGDIPGHAEQSVLVHLSGQANPHAELSKEDKNIATVNFLRELWDIVAHDNQWRDEELKKSLMRFPTENTIKVKGKDWEIYVASYAIATGPWWSNVIPMLLVPECAVTCARSMIQMKSRVRQIVVAPPGTDAAGSLSPSTSLSRLLISWSLFAHLTIKATLPITSVADGMVSSRPSVSGFYYARNLR
ncbi:hypothetical protein ASPTUDRAFT_30390 [Aspergillus tubingensis CBS 134.48]|uniref:Uncharacterized protein n=1 Tax=Aspergillus tubingensis (strain CBS 134.48) TaxID=767770 RepID=A0A1L9N5E0_ASPTC|nr:hypothetical protein ASPTUDRAFT_30390 [Aspergillus tubingensis CBS 134.48]